MSNSYSELIKEVTTLEGYSYQIWAYKVSLACLTIRARHPDRPGHNIHIIFQAVAYIQMPTFWIGDFRLGSEVERREIAQKIGLDDFKSGELFKANTSKGSIFLLGSVADIVQDVEPIY